MAVRQIVSDGSLTRYNASGIIPSVAFVHHNQHGNVKVMPGKNSPSKKQSSERFKSIQYARGAERSLRVGLRLAEQLQLSPDETVKFLRVLRDELNSMLDTRDIEAPMIDRAITATIAKVNAAAAV